MRKFKVNISGKGYIINAKDGVEAVEKVIKAKDEMKYAIVYYLKNGQYGINYYASEEKANEHLPFYLNNSNYASAKVHKLNNVQDERLSPMTYKKLKELGYKPNDWKNLTQEKANEIVAKGNKGSVSKEKTEENIKKEENKVKNKFIPKDKHEKEIMDIIKSHFRNAGGIKSTLEKTKENAYETYGFAFKGGPDEEAKAEIDRMCEEAFEEEKRKISVWNGSRSSMDSSKYVQKQLNNIKNGQTIKIRDYNEDIHVEITRNGDEFVYREYIPENEEYNESKWGYGQKQVLSKDEAARNLSQFFEDSYDIITSRVK